MKLTLLEEARVIEVNAEPGSPLQVLQACLTATVEKVNAGEPGPFVCIDGKLVSYAEHRKQVG